MKRITLVTGNQNKLREIHEILGMDKISSAGCEIVAEKIDLDELQGEMDFIARRKCQLAYQLLKRAVLIEDSSICFDGLNGLPGPYAKWFLEKMGAGAMYKMLDGFENKRGQAVCIFSYCDGPNEGDVKLFHGVVPGKIVAPRGQAGFGWDVIFQPDGYEKTFAELEPAEKNQISHRACALKLFGKFMRETLCS